MTKIAVLGGGQIGEALVSGLVNAGYEPADIVVTNRRSERGEQLHGTYGVSVTSDNAAAIDGAEYIFACVKPTPSSSCWKASIFPRTPSWCPWLRD